MYSASTGEQYKRFNKLFSLQKFPGHLCYLKCASSKCIPEKAPDHPLCSHISNQVYDIRSLAPNTAAGSTHTSPELQGTLHTDYILQHRQGDPSLRSKTTNCRPLRNLHRFGTKQQVQEIISFKRQVGVKLTFLSYLMLSPTGKRRLRRGGKKRYT